MIEKYHVYILGAGASFHAGLPILSDFFHKAEALCEGNSARQPACNGYKEAIEFIRRFRTENIKNCQSQNVEDVYRLALESNNVEILNALENVILGILDLHGCLVNFDGKQYNPNGVYEAFIKKIFPSGEGVWSGRQNINSTAIITFNWDCLIDYAMFYHNMTPYYGIGQYSKSNTPKIFKMHGSINWGFCRACNSTIQPIPPQEFVGLRHIGKPMEFDLRVVTEGWGRKKCSCGKPLSPKIIPPTYRKNLSNDVKALWDEAKEVLKKAHQITLIGYSFPRTDVDFLNLVQNALESNIDLMRVDVIDPKNSDDSFRSNYKNNFGSHATKIQFGDLVTFEKYVTAFGRSQ